MMKKISYLIVFCIITFFFNTSTHAMTIQYDGITEEYTGSVYDLKVNGKSVSMPIPPIIFNDRALVPVREIFEELGASVVYEEKTKCVNISYYGNTVSLYINNPSAYINGKKTAIPDKAVPKLINIVGSSAKTMVPVRFISESLNMNVDFRNNTIYISNGDEPEDTPAPTPGNTHNNPAAGGGSSALTGISFLSSGESGIVITASISGTVPETNSFALSNPTRFVIDLSECKMNTPQTSYDVGVSGISKIRIGHENNRTRIVVDAEKISDTKVYTENNAVIIEVSASGALPSETAPPSKPALPSSGENNTSSASIEKIPHAEYSNSQKLIVIDAGHGGSDGGAQGSLDGKTVLEKDLTLSISKKVRDTLSAKGYNVAMTRDSDEYPTLNARSEFANASNAAVFVSVHINSVESAPTASGTEVYYSSINNEDSYGVKSSYLAKCILDELIKNLGSKNRGVKQANHVVTRTSLMPAALVEVGFISNTDELANMCNETYQQKTADSIAAGIVKALEKIAIPENRTELEQQRAADLNEWEKSQ
ncbi:MAG: N-acetylmuramoyl-L-alanine amidase [Clostridia bacterium]|nr:N-acetylmuramoyl-L-alanine amidase [Clostridia bacterium]